MRRTHYFGLIAAFAVAQGALIYGCSADAGAPIEDVDSGPAAVPDATTTEDAPVVLEDDTGTTIPDASKKDTSIADAKPDTRLTRPDTGAPGSPCVSNGAPESQACGKCGTQLRSCIAGPGGADAGTVWGPWGACTGEAPEPSCDPYETDAGTEPCGNCGTRVRICQPDCKLAQGIVCQGEPPNACTPGDQSFTLSCTNPTEGRIATCEANCQYGLPGACVPPPPNQNTMTISATVGGVATKKFTLTAAKKLAKINTGTCPVTVSTTLTSYIYVEIKNPTARSVKVSIWDTAATAGPTDMIMAAYPGAVPPQDSDANARKACVNYSMNGCDSTVPTACTSIFLPGLMIDEVPDHSVTIPAGGSVSVYNAAYSGTPVGDFNLNTRTEN